jgi:hypothetical protein
VRTGRGMFGCLLYAASPGSFPSQAAAVAAACPGSSRSTLLHS